MKCRICNQKMHEREGEDSDHHLHVGFVDRSVCIGCWVGSVQLELFLTRAQGMASTPMGDWTSGWLREIVKDPRRYL
jgi:hypothetical protein